MLRLLPLLLVFFVALPAGATTYFSIQNVELINHTVGPDGLWGTPDDEVTEGINSLGMASQGTFFDAEGNIVGFGAGPLELDFPDFSQAVVLGPTDNFSFSSIDIDFLTSAVDDPGETPHVFTVFPDNTTSFAFTQVSCDGPPGCGDPTIVLDFTGSSIYWRAVDDPTAIDALTTSPFGDLSDYALLMESFAPANATAYTISIGLLELTPDNVSGSLVDESWFGGAFFYSNATYTTAPIPEPSTALLIGLGLVGLAGRKRLAA